MCGFPADTEPSSHGGHDSSGPIGTIHEKNHMMSDKKRARKFLATGVVAVSAVALAVSAQASPTPAGQFTVQASTAKKAPYVARARFALNARSAATVNGILAAKIPILNRLPLDANGRLPASVITPGDSATLGGQSLAQLQAGATAALQARQVTPANLVPAAAASTVVSLSLPTGGSYLVNVTSDLSATAATADKGSSVTITTSAGTSRLSESRVVLQPAVAVGTSSTDADTVAASYVVTVTAARTVSVTAANGATGVDAVAAKMDDTAVTASRLGPAVGAIAVP